MFECSTDFSISSVCGWSEKRKVEEAEERKIKSLTIIGTFAISRNKAGGNHMLFKLLNLLWSPLLFIFKISLFKLL